MVMSKASSGRLKSPPLVFFSTKSCCLCLGTAQLYLPLLALPPWDSSSAPCRGAFLRQALMGAAPQPAPTGQTKSFCTQGKVGINPFVNPRGCTPREFVTQQHGPVPIPSPPSGTCSPRHGQEADGKLLKKGEGEAETFPGEVWHQHPDPSKCLVLSFTRVIQ